jgi:hypothetical protein
MAKKPPQNAPFGVRRGFIPRKRGHLLGGRVAGEDVLDVERARIATTERIIDNATIAAYNSDSKHRITKDANV